MRTIIAEDVRTVLKGTEELKALTAADEAVNNTADVARESNSTSAELASAASRLSSAVSDFVRGIEAA